VANTLGVFRNGAVGFIDWLGHCIARAGSEAGKPSAYLFRVQLVRPAKAPAESRLLVADNKEIGCEKPDCPVENERSRSREKGLTENDRRDTQIHGISDVSIQASNNQLPRCIHRGEGAASAPGELPDAACEERDANADAKEAGEVLRTQKIKTQPIQPEKPPRHIPRDEARKQGRPQKAPKSQKSGTPEGAIRIQMRAHGSNETEISHGRVLWQTL
jgi:hypothetical protein